MNRSWRLWVHYSFLCCQLYFIRISWWIETKTEEKRAERIEFEIKIENKDSH